MDKRIVIVLIVLVLLLGGTGFAVYRSLTAPASAPVAKSDEPSTEGLPAVDSSVKVDLVKNAKAADTVTLSISGMDGKMSQVGYELTYDSQGLIKGVNSGSKPLDVAGKDTFSRDVYLGTCSKNDCKPDKGVSVITVALEFTATDGKKYQFSKDFHL